MNQPKLSKYTEEKFVEFLKNKSIQDTINDVIIFSGITSVDEIEQIFLTMFLTTVSISKLSKEDLELLKLRIKEIRSVEVVYPPIKDHVLPEPTDEFIKNTIKNKVDNGYKELKYGKIQI